MAEDPIQILEVRAAGAPSSVAITVAVTADASHAIFTALSEQLDRQRRDATASVEDVLALRQRIELVERFAPLAASRAHAIVQLNEQELRDCLLDLTAYRERVDGEHFQPPELRQRLRLTAEIIGILWDANATVAAALDALLSQPAP
jgi:hypothetical protein